MLKEIDASYIERKLVEQLTAKPVNFVEKVAQPIIKAGEELGKEVERTISSK